MGHVFGHIWVAQCRQMQAVLKIVTWQNGQAGCRLGSGGHPLSRHPHHCHDVSTLTALWNHSRYACQFPRNLSDVSYAREGMVPREASRAPRPHQYDIDMFENIFDNPCSSW